MSNDWVGVRRIVCMKAQRVPVWLVTIGALAFGGCSADDQLAPALIPLNSIAVPSASDPLAASSAASSSALIGGRTSGLSARLSADGEVTYVSLPPATVPDGGIAIIDNARLAVAETTAVQYGGFDPVSIAATVGDNLVITVRRTGGLVSTLELSVPRKARPRVVRASPPPRKRGGPRATGGLRWTPRPRSVAPGSNSQPKSAVEVSVPVRLPRGRTTLIGISIVTGSSDTISPSPSGRPGSSG
jgi:hypothetical protein